MGDMSHWGTTILANQHRNVTVVQKRACKVTTSWVYKYAYIQFFWMTTQCEDLTRYMLHAVTTTHKKAMPNTTLEQIQTSTTTEMQLCM